MILKEFGQPYCYGDNICCIGDPVYANRHSAYEGLFGKIIEIRDGSDRLTGCDGPEFYCAFSKPVLPDVIHRLERRISHRDRKPTMLHEIDLSRILLSPEQVKVMEEGDLVSFDVGCFRLNVEWIINGSKSTISLLFSDYLVARKRFMEMLETEINSGCIDAWSQRDEFYVNCDKEWFECWLVGQCESNHYRIALDRENLRLTADAVQAIGQIYLDQQFRKDFLARISVSGAIERLPKDMQNLFLNDLSVPDCVRKAIAECSPIKEAYEEVMDVAARILMIQYAQRLNRPACYTAKYEALDSLCEGKGLDQCKTCPLCCNTEGGGSNE